MPAVSICDSVSTVLRHSLDDSQSKATDELATNLIGNASRMLQSGVEYDEYDNFQVAALDELKTKYIVLSVPKLDTLEENKIKDGTICSKKNNNVKMGPSLPTPTIVLYPAQKVSLGWKGKFPIGAGMYNVGNTCYLNSTLQVLFHVPALVNWLLSDPHHSSKCEQNDGGGECLTCAMAKTLQFSHQNSGCAFKPFSIYNKLKLICRTMVPGQQEDAHEFLRYLLEGMERAYLVRHKASKLDSYSKETTPINQIFGGYIRTEVKCLQCRHVSTTFQHFQDLLVDIRKASSLDEALSSYFSKEQLDNNDYKCEACKRRVPATKQFSLERPPKVLCVQLKRFSVLGGKISRHIGFKQTIDMGPYLWRESGEPPRQLTYKLMSMVTHMGPSVNCGHYTSIAQVSTGQYYSFDDSCVRPISLSNVLSTNAYIMIFEMEQQTQNQTLAKINGTSAVKSTLDSPTTSICKPINTKASTSGLFPLNGSLNGFSNLKNETKSNNIDTSSSLQTPPKKSGSQQSTQKDSNFIGPQLPQKLQEKSQPRIVMQIKNGKVLNGNSLVPYDGSSEEEDGNSSQSKNHSSSSTIPKSTISSLTSNGVNKNSSTKDVSSTKPVPTIKDVPKSKYSEIKSFSNGTATQNQSYLNTNKKTASSNHNNESTLNKSQNGKIETNGKSENKGKDKFHSVRTKSSQDEKVATRATDNSWLVSKEESSPVPVTTPNGWSVTDKEEHSKGNQNNGTPSAAAIRNFNGTNRSDTVSQLMKLSHRGYGSSSVTTWNGNRSHLDREVDNERREERKRHFNPDDEEMDRGRVKKVKSHRTYENRSNPGYNPFQEYQNGKSWNRSPNGYYRKNYYNTSHGRSRHGGNNYRHSNHRYHNHSRSHWQRG